MEIFKLLKKVKKMKITQRLLFLLCIIIPSVVSSEVVHTLVLKGNYLWVGTDNGAVRWNIGSLTYDTYSKKENGLSSNDIMAIAVDQNGQPWFGTKDGGICTESGDNGWKCYMELDGVVSNFIYCAGTDKKGALWFGSKISGVSRFNRETKKWENFTIADGLVSNSIRHICVRANGEVWLATDKGISIQRNNQWNSLTTANGLQSDDVRSCFEDKQGDVWIACGEALGQKGGVGKYDASTGKWVFYSKDNGIGDNDVYCVTADNQGIIWCGTYGGVSKYGKGTAWTNYNLPDSPLRDEWVYDLDIDQNNGMWLGTSKGLYKFDGNRNWSLLEVK
jgi:ligand-binding sensor domain-containing protein